MNPSATSSPRVPRFSVAYMDRSVDPARDFYGYATGAWRRDNPVPADKAIWGAFAELIERNYLLLREILESSASDANAPAASPRRQVGDFYASALDQARRDALGFAPIRPYLDRIEAATSTADVVHLLAGFHDTAIWALFRPFVYPDRNRSSIYALYLYQGDSAFPTASTTSRSRSPRSARRTGLTSRACSGSWGSPNPRSMRRPRRSSGSRRSSPGQAGAPPTSGTTRKTTTR